MNLRIPLCLAALLLCLPIAVAASPAAPTAPTATDALPSLPIFRDASGLFLPPTLPKTADLPCLRCSGSGKILRPADTTVGRRTDLGAAGSLRCPGAGKRTPRAADREISHEGRSRTPTRRITKKELLMICPQCGGKGHCIREYLVSEKLPALRLLRHKYDAEQLNAGRIPIGGAYGERSQTDRLSPQDFAALAHRCPKVCSTCLGLGRICCKRCDGLGCEPGKLDRETGIREADEPCESCNSRGDILCKRCDGSGLARLCSSCDGTGLRKKRDRDAPTGYRFVLCTSCDGSGRR